MCMISLPVEQVSNTNIFVGLNSTKTRQITIYSNYVANYSNANAMVIPVPYPQSVQFHDMSQMGKFFANVDKSFYRLSNTFGGSFLSTNSTNSLKSRSANLEVFNVGSYKVSLAQSLDDLTRLDKDIFILSEGLGQMLGDNYRERFWGFIVFVLAKESKEYHPFGYSHTLFNGQIYIPTKHYHDHSSSLGFVKSDVLDYRERIGGQDTRIDPYSTNQRQVMNDGPLRLNQLHLADDWSHNIYLFNCGTSAKRSNLLRSMLNPDINYGWDNNLYWNRRLIDFDLLSCDGFEKYKIEGSHPNVDLMLPLC